MATINGTYSCGHAGSVYYTGRARDNQYRADKDFERLCPECKAIEDADKLAALDAQNAASGIPALSGSLKQQLWGQRIRADRIEYVNAAMQDQARDWPETQSHIAQVLDGLRQLLRDRTAAHWWIDNRDMAGRQLIRLCESMASVAAIDADPDAMAANAESVVAPDRLTVPVSAKTEDIAEIIVGEMAVGVISPKNQLVIDTVRACGFRWDGVANRWQMPIDAASGSAADRAVEVGNALLCAGVPIILYDPDLATRAVYGEFAPRNQRWVRVSPGGKKFALHYERNDALYAEAMRVLGARWDAAQRCLTVPVDRWQAVLDFADACKFTLSTAAQQKVELLQIQRQNALLAAPKKPSKRNANASVANIMDANNGSVIPDLLD